VYAQSLRDDLPADSRMELYLTGKEDVKVRYEETEYYTDSDGERQSRTHTRYAYSTRDIVRITVPIASDVTNGYVGRYEYPFEVRNYDRNFQTHDFILTVL